MPKPLEPYRLRQDTKRGGVKKDNTSLAGNPVRLKVKLKRGKLFAFQFIGET